MIKKSLKKARDREFYSLRSLLGYFNNSKNSPLFALLVGGREAGKSYAVMEYFIKKFKECGNPFVWIRLSETSVKKMMANKAEKLVDADLVRKYDLELTTKNMVVYDHGKEMCKVLALSEMAKLKGVALFDKDFLKLHPKWNYHIACDEVIRERQEKRTFDLGYNLVNTLENLIRSVKERTKIFFICNLLEDAAEICQLFNFIPQEFGRYYIRKKRLIVDYIEPSRSYLKRREGTVADLLANDESTFTNKLDLDLKLIIDRKREKLRKPLYLVKFDKKNNTWFVIWESDKGCIIRRYKGEDVKVIIAMRPYLDVRFFQEWRDDIINKYDLQNYKYYDLISQKMFERELIRLKARGH